MAEKEIEEYEEELIHTTELNGSLQVYCQFRSKNINDYVARISYNGEYSAHINFEAANDEDAVEEAKQYFGVK
jgi:hypothetical protein